MSELWVPPGSEVRRVTVPTSDIVLANTWCLHYRGVFGAQPEGGLLVRFHRWDGPSRLSVQAAMDNTPHGRLLHVSLAYPDKDPPWAVIRLVKDAFYGDNIDAMMVLPKAADYVNEHPHCFHIWATPVSWGIQ